MGNVRRTRTVSNIQDDLVPILGPEARNGIPTPDGLLAWSRSQCLVFLRRLGSTKVAVLSGEFLRIDPIDPIGLVPTKESWICARVPGETASEFASRSRELAKHKIDDESNDELLVVLDFSNQQNAA